MSAKGMHKVHYTVGFILVSIQLASYKGLAVRAALYQCGVDSIQNKAAKECLCAGNNIDRIQVQ